MCAELPSFGLKFIGHVVVIFPFRSGFLFLNGFKCSYPGVKNVNVVCNDLHLAK